MIASFDQQHQLDQFYRDTYERLKLGRASKHCKYQYVLNIKRLGRHLGRAPLVSDLTDVNITTVCQAILDAGNSPATANKVRAQFMALAGEAKNQGLLATLPRMQKLREYARIPTAWTEAQIRRLFASCRIEQGKMGSVSAASWWLALHYVLWDTGVRIGALLQVKWGQLDLDRPTILVLAEQQKDDADQVFFLRPRSVAALRAIVRPERKLVFDYDCTRETLYNRYKGILTRAGLPTTRRDKFHRMRRSVASHYEAAGGNATELLGHSSRRITRAYLDPTIVKQRQASDVLFEPEGEAT